MKNKNNLPTAHVLQNLRHVAHAVGIVRAHYEDPAIDPITKETYCSQKKRDLLLHKRDLHKRRTKETYPVLRHTPTHPHVL